MMMDRLAKTENKKRLEHIDDFVKNSINLNRGELSHDQKPVKF